MTPKIQINNEAEVCHIEIEGTIGVPEEWQFEEPDSRVATYERFREAVSQIAAIESPEVVVTIRSTGGDVNDALLIHDALAQLDAHITTRCYGYTASAATIIAQAASEGCREISANALYLIHQATCTTEGNAAQLAEQQALLEATDTRLASLYAARSGGSVEAFRTLMAENNGNGRWLSPEEVIEAGLADCIIGSDSTNAPAPEQPAEAPAETATTGWKRLMCAIGLGSTKPAPTSMPEDRNILHFEQEERALRRRSTAATAAALKQLQPTRTQPTEDPSHRDTLRSANEKAYADDLKRLLSR